SSWNRGPISLEELPVGDDRLSRFVGTREPDDDIDVWMANRREQQTSLARELDELTAVEGVAEYQRLVVEASVFQGHSEGDLFASVLADQVSNSGAWLEAAVEVRVRPLVAPLVAKARADGADISDLVRGALEIPELRSSVLRAITQEEDELDDLAHAVIDGLTDDDVPLIGELWVRES